MNTCFICKQTINRENKFCSRKCMGIHFGNSRKGQNNTFYRKKHSLKTRKKLSRMASQRTGEKNPNWKGGHKILDGYFALRRPNHHRAIQNYVKRCILVMEKHIGRNLIEKEVVHHIDENKLNDNLDNLQLFASESLHQKYHYKLRNRNKKGQFTKQIRKISK